MTSLAQALSSVHVAPGSLAIFWLGQAGFAFKTPGSELIYIDAYLSNMCETILGGGVMSKRLIPPPLQPTEIVSGLMVSTHAHQDHNDEESIAIIARNSPQVNFAGPVSCMRVQEKLAIKAERMHLLVVGNTYAYEGFLLRPVYADHGDLEPDAVGIVLEADGITVYHTGDTSYCPERMEEVVNLKPDIIIPCINGAYGNLNAIEAARLANDVGAKVAIPSHFWFFIGQNTSADATPAAFLEACENFAPHTKPVILMVGEPYIYRKD